MLNGFLGCDIHVDDFVCNKDGIRDVKNKVIEDSITETSEENKAGGETKASGETKAVGKVKRKSTVEKGLEAVFDKFKKAACEDFKRYVMREIY